MSVQLGDDLGRVTPPPSAGHAHFKGQPLLMSTGPWLLLLLFLIGFDSENSFSNLLR